MNVSTPDANPTHIPAHFPASIPSFSGNPATRDHLINGLSGLIAGACGVVVGHPFDTMKTRLQVGDVSKAPSLRMRSPWELYRGVFPPLFTTGLTQFALFAMYEHIKDELIEGPLAGDAKNLANLKSTFVAGTIAGAVTSYVTSPIHLLKVQQQASTSAITLRNCVKSVVQKNGYKGLLHGSVFVLSVEGFNRGFYMTTYEYLKTKISGDDAREMTLQTRAISAGLANSLTWLLIYPLDSIKSRRLSDLNSKSSYQCLKETIKHGGIFALYRGCALAVLRSAPVAATVLPLYEHLRGMLDAAI